MGPCSKYKWPWKGESQHLMAMVPRLAGCLGRGQSQGEVRDAWAGTALGWVRDFPQHRHSFTSGKDQGMGWKSIPRFLTTFHNLVIFPQSDPRLQVPCTRDCPREEVAGSVGGPRAMVAYMGMSECGIEAISRINGLHNLM